MKKPYWVLLGLTLGVSGACGASGGSGAGPSNAGYNQDAAATWSPGGASGSGGASGIVMNFDAAGAAADAYVLPPEKEQNLDFLAPRAGARYVYVANPTRNTVTVIDSTTLAIVELAPGDSPTYMATVPGRDIALVINTGSHTLRILSDKDMNAGPIPIVSKANAIAISPDGLHAVIWFDSTQTSSSSSQTTATSTTGSTQEVSVVTVTPKTPGTPAQGSVISMSVGYNPSAVVFSSDNAAAFVVTDDGISELRFANITAPGIAPFTRIDNTTTSLTHPDAGAAPAPDTTPAPPDTTPAPATPPATGTPVDVDAGTIPDGGGSTDGGASSDGQIAAPDLAPPDTYVPPPSDTAPVSPPPSSPAATGKPVDVSVTPDGAYAIARREASSELLLVNLKTHKVTALDLSSQITDLDLLPSGTAAFAVLRKESLLVRIDIPSGFSDPAHRTAWQFSGQDIGSVSMSAQGKYALLYVTATQVNSLVIFDPANESYLSVNLQKAVRAVAVAPDENTALVLHPAPTTPGTGGTSGKGGASGSGGTSGASTSTSAIDKAYGYTLVHLEDGFSKLQQTAAEPNPFAITPNSSHAFVLLRDDKAGVRIAERINLTSFIADDFPLGSPPNSIAALADTQKVFVGQVYSEGRISFIDWVSGNVQTVTGFALNGRIQQ